MEGVARHSITLVISAVVAFGCSKRPSTSTSPLSGETKQAVEEYAKNLRGQTILKIQLQPIGPVTAASPVESYPWKTNIVTTIFWVGGGDQFGQSRSAWNKNWLQAYGGVDTPDPGKRRNYIPVGFTPRLNPFYCALPYNDVMNGQFKPEAPLVIPWFKTAYTEPGRSVCEDRWVAIRKGNRTCFAQWQDCGPFTTHQFEYVFLNERPRANLNHGAGLDVSPAVRDYLGLTPTDVTDWHFVEVRDVPPGPWRTYGDNNHFIRGRRQREMEILPEFHPNPRV